MIEITVNGEARQTATSTLATLWEAEAKERDLPSRKGFAIALNGAVVRAAAWEHTPLREGDTVEIIRAMAGG